MDQLKNMKDSLISVVQSQISGNLEKVQAKELGEAIDMIKDLSEAIYYCTVTEAMEKSEWEKPVENYYYSQRVLPRDYADDRMGGGMMYYNGGSSSGNRGGQGGMSSGGRRSYQESYPPYGMLPPARDLREGRSPMYRKMYMEGKMMHDKSKSMQELDEYMQELTSDLSEMIQDASPEEKQLLQQKIATLAGKIK